MYVKIKSYMLLASIIVCLNHHLTAQDAEALIGRIMEDIYEGQDLENVPSEIRDDLLLLYEEPVNINTDDLKKLRHLHLLNDIQARNLRDYRKKYGPFMTIYELQVVEAFSRKSIEKIMPFVYAGPADAPPINISKSRIGNELLLRVQRQLSLPAGYIIPPDSVQLEKPNSFYLGDPFRYFLRYRMKAGSHVQLNFTAEKDPGEMFPGIPSKINTKIASNLSRPNGFDRYAGNINVSDLGVLAALVVGDYHVQCGQGLVLWSGMSFSGSTDPSAFKRYSQVVRANSSAEENRSLRGIAGTLEWKNFSLSLFFSRKKIDARVETYEDGTAIVKSLPESGYHRTLSEIGTRHMLGTTHYGGHLMYSGNRLRAGLTAYRTMFDIGLADKDMMSGEKPFSGKDNLNMGINLEYILRKAVLFGELGYCMNGGFAALAGVTHNTSNGSIISLLLREYRRDYQDLMSEATGRRSNNANERGLKMALEVPLAKRLSLNMYTEHYTYPSLISGNNNIVRGLKQELSLSWNISRSSDMDVRYRFERALDNESSNNHWFDKMLFIEKQRFRIKMSREVSECFSLKALLEYVMIKEIGNGSAEQGSLLALDFFYRPLHDKFRVSCRYALFNTDGYASRLYAYEHDVLFASSMPAYYGKGFRTYLLLQYSPARWFETWLRLALTTYTDRNVIGSGLDEIKGNKKSEIKLQCRFRL